METYIDSYPDMYPETYSDSYVDAYQIPFDNEPPIEDYDSSSNKLLHFIGLMLFNLL